jgi:branched-chain amino acid transport system substrate-binding protein
VGEGAPVSPITRAVLLCLLLVTLSGLPADAQPGVGDTEIVLGSTSFAGPLAFTGEQITKFGLDLYFRVVNEAGGIHGRKVRTVSYAADSDMPQEAVANIKRLVEQDRVFAIIVPQGSRPVAATLEYLEANKVPLLFPYQSSPVTRGRRYVFPGMALSDRSSKMMIDYLAGPRKYRKFAVLYQDDEYGTSFLKALEKDLGRFGRKLVAVQSVKHGVIDVSPQIAKLRAAKPEVTFLVLVPGPAVQALRERRKTGWTDTLMVSTGPLTDEGYLALAGDDAEGVEGLSLWPDPQTSDLPGVKLYREHMLRNFPKNEPSRYSLAGYFGGMLFTEAAKRAGRNLTRESLIAALESIKGFESGILPPLTIGHDHETQKQGFWVRVEKGRFKPLTDWLKSE